MNPTLGLIVIALVLLLLIASGIRIYNRLVMLDQNIEKAYANIDVLLKQRADEIPELVKIVKEYMKYEAGTLNKLTSMRTELLNTTDKNKKIEKHNEISSAFANILAVSENYPELKASGSFISLQGRVSQIEDHISDRRELFNDSINLFNIGIKEFPALLMAAPFGYTEKTLLIITDAEKQYDGIQF